METKTKLLIKQNIKQNNLRIRKALALRNLRDCEKLKYKRVALSPLRYPGGKTLAVGHIIELIPPTITRLVSPFLGGASVEIAVNKFLKIPVLGFDIFNLLINYWKYQINEPILLYNEFKKLKPDRKTYEEIRSLLKHYWEGKVEIEPLKLAAYFFYQMSLSYGPSFLGSFSENNSKKYRYRCRMIKNFRVENFSVECADFRDVMKKYRKDFMYLDPPYYIKNVKNGFYPSVEKPVFHVDFPHETLRDLLHKHEGGFILSYNDCATIREYYKEFNIKELSWQYSFSKDLPNKIGRELLIYSIPESESRTDEWW